ncbi:MULTISPECIES: hypothetical protein [unclassified Pseudomonas]|uniref:Uncharacterized protein n=1 Tax=Pseudomonas sp. MYb327 TaxID=2745230 RepID=A0AAU8E7S6_9PSED
MTGYQADTFQCPRLMKYQQLVDFFEVSEKKRITSFFISCTKRLWECVGHFLGRMAYSHQAQPAGLFSGSEGVHCASTCQTIQMLA